MHDFFFFGCFARMLTCQMLTSTKQKHKKLKMLFSRHITTTLACIFRTENMAYDWHYSLTETIFIWMLYLPLDLFEPINWIFSSISFTSDWDFVSIFDDIWISFDNTIEHNLQRLHWHKQLIPIFNSLLINNKNYAKRRVHSFLCVIYNYTFIYLQMVSWITFNLLLNSQWKYEFFGNQNARINVRSLKLFHLLWIYLFFFFWFLDWFVNNTNSNNNKNNKKKFVGKGME